MNSVNLTGYLGNDAELTMHGSGRGRLGFSVAVTGYGGRDGKGDVQKTTTWVPCVMWGDRTVPLQRFLAKGAFVEVTGKLQTYPRKLEDNKVVNVMYVEVDEIGLGPKRNQDK